MSARKFSPFPVFGALLLWASLGFSQNAGRQPGSVDKFVTNLSGYQVIEGFGMRLNPGDLCCRGILPAAIYFNQTAPYATFAVQPVESPLIDFKEIPVFQLAPDEAIVLIGVTPPEAKFFAYQPYLLMRFYPDPETGKLQPKGIFASLGDGINVSTVKTIGPDPFNKPVVLIFTPDQGTDARVRAALHNAGYPDAIINTLPFPAHMLNLGLDRKVNDYFILAQRSAMFTNEAAGQAYIDSMSNSDVTKRSVRVFRVTPKVSGALQPFPAPPLRIRGTGHSEVDMTPLLNELRQAILKYWDAKGYHATEYHTRHIAYDANEYIGSQKNVLGDSRDSFYMAAGYEPMLDLNDKLTLDEGDFLVAYGLNHVATGKATYTNINVYSWQAMFPLGSIYSDQFPVSVEPYLSYLRADFPAGLMYAVQLARPSQCVGVCLKLEDPPTPCNPWCGPGVKDCPQLLFDSKTLLGVYFRNYLEPPTGVGAAASEILYDQLIKFSRNN